MMKISNGVETKTQNLITKPPVVVVLGHIDHGKCLAPNTLVSLTSGEILSIEKIWARYVRKSNKQYIKERGKEGWIGKPSPEIKIFSFNEGKVVKQKVSHIWQLKAPPKLIKVTLNSGDEVIVTPEHPFFLFTPNGKFEKKRADLLEKGEFVIVPQKLEFFTSTTAIKRKIIQKLERSNNLVIFLNKEKGENFFKKLRPLNKQELYRKRLFSEGPYYAFKQNRFRARDFVKIGRYLNFSFEALYDMIEFIRAGTRSNKIKLPRLPEDLEKLGYFTGCLAGDGQTEDEKLHSSNPEIQNIFQEYLKKIFGVSTKLVKTRTSFQIENSGYETLTKFLTDILDFPRYKKSKKIGFPKILSGSLPFIKGFIAGEFDTDGYVSPNNHSVELSSKNKNLIKGISILLLRFGIHSAIYRVKKKGPGFKKKKTYWCLRIANNPYLKKFLNYFPIKHSEKKRRIQTAITKSSVSRIFDLTPISGQNLYPFYINEYLLSYFSQLRKYKFLSRYFLQKLLRFENKISLPKIFLETGVKNLLNPGEISCVKVRKLEYLKNKYEFVYDLTVPYSHNFVAERIFVHNTSLLLAIRRMEVPPGKPGGVITQHIGAYEIEREGKKITFIDTPGHEAFSQMRSRGAKVADIAVLVIDAAEGIQLQTKEAISQAKLAEIPIIVALNKIDRSEANPEQVKRELQKEGILVESLGGKTPTVETSAISGKGIPELLELILLIAEMENLKADITAPAEGVIIESYLDGQRGPIATLISNQGILRPGQIIGTPSAVGKIKTLENFQAVSIPEALPSQPAVVLGFENVPRSGEKFKTFPDMEKARANLKIEEKIVPQATSAESGQKVLNLILKTDVLGSLEAVEGVLKNLPQEKIVLRILKGEVGEITESDIKLALQAKAKILGYRVKINPAVAVFLEREKIKIMQFDVIYDLVEGVRKHMEKLLLPKIVRTDLGKIKTLVVFLTEKNRQIVGGKVTEGEIKKGVLIEIQREGEIVGRGKVINLQRNKKDAERVGKGDEAGILYEGNVKIEVGDVLLIYQEERKKAEL